MIFTLFVVLLQTLIIHNTVQETTKTSFSCEQRPSGYYADLETGCQVYHMCDGLGRQFSYSCPNATLFQQRMLICDHWYMVNCSNSEVDYRANLLIGQRDKPFLEDSEKPPYHRTPRPDLLTNYKIPEYNNLVHRNGRSQISSNFNLVGIETDSEHNSSFGTAQQLYTLPSHWFTKYSNTIIPTPKHEDKKFYTKPKYSKIIDDNNQKITTENHKTKLKSVINENAQFNFQNKMQSKNTEQFAVAFTEPKDKRPTPTNTAGDLINKNRMPQTAEKISSNLDINLRSTSKKPSLQETRITEMHWKHLRNLFLIPEYEFPLDSVARPGYENGQSSFEVNSSLSNFHKK